MISLLINYLLTQPSVETAPLVVALQSSGLKTQLGGTDVSINLVNTRDWEGSAPYAKLFDTGDVELLQTFIGGPNRIWMDKVYMGIEVAANGPDPSIAALNADYLRLAVEGAIQPLIQSVRPDVLTMNDLGGSNSKDEIKQVYIKGGTTNKVVMGPGKDGTDPKWTVIRSSRVEVWVQHTRTKN